MTLKIITVVAVFGLLVGCSRSPDTPEDTPIPPTPEDLPLEYSVVGDWGQSINGLRCRLAVGKPTFKPSERLTFRLEMQNILKEPLNILLESRGWFGNVMIDGANKMGWVPPAGKFRNAYRTLKSNEIISTSDFAPIHQVPIAEGKHVLTGQYSNTINTSNKYFDGWSGTAVKLWTGTEAVHMVASGPIEITIEAGKK